MNKLSLLLFFCGVYFSTASLAQTQVEVSTQNLNIDGTNLQFDIFLRTTNPNDIVYLGDATFILTFNSGAFTNPIIQKIGPSPGSNTFTPSDPTGSNTFFTRNNYFVNIGTTPVIGDELKVILNGLTPTNSFTFDSRVARIDGTALTHRLATFQISGFNGGTPNLAWKIAGAGEITQIATYADTAPYTASNTIVIDENPSCPEALMNFVAPSINVTNSTCQADQAEPSGGSFDPTFGCLVGSNIEFSIDNGNTWSLDLPSYNQSMPMTVSTRCICIQDPSIVSQVSTLTTNPGVCVGSCSITALTANNISACNDNNTPNDPSDDFFTADITITFDNAPSSGSLELTGDGNATIGVSGIGSTSHTFNAVPLSADGNSFSLTASFSADANCSFTNNNVGTAPNACSDGNTGGGGANCEEVAFIGGEGQITLSNLNAQSKKIEYLGAPTNWQTILVCDGDCATTQTIPNLAAGTYTVKLFMQGADGTFCFRQEEIEVTNGMGNPCDNQGGDADGDGVCANMDCDDNDASIGASQTPGTSCNDGNPSTINDVILADGCTCQGENNTGGGTANCDIVTFTGGPGLFSLSNLFAQSEKIEYFGAPTNWQTVVACDGNCAEVQTVTGLSSGTYVVKLLMLGNDGSFCFREAEIEVEDGLSLPCANRGGDADTDGVCADVDCDDNNPAIGASQSPGKACDDGNPNTSNDVILADGCTCQGETNTGGSVDCDAVNFTGGAGNITLANLNAPSEKIDILGAPTNYVPITVCDGDCDATQVISNLAAGTYIVKLFMAGDAVGCYREETVQVTASLRTATDRTTDQLHFSGFSQLQNIELQWVQVDQRPKNYFVLEKSIDGQLFEPILIKPSEDQDNDLATYVELDEQPVEGNNYYRIGTAFSDGDFSYSKVLQIPFQPLTHFSIFPNPIGQSEDLFVNLADFAGQAVQLTVTNSLGQPIQMLKVDQLDKTPTRIALVDLEDGVYAISVKVMGKPLQTKRFIVQRL